jgi:hypothetical protein
MKFVSKDLAIKLKEKGFDRPCLGFYNPIQDELQLYCANNKDVTYKNILTSVYKNKVLVDAPTIEQVLKWLREEKDIDIVIYPIDRNTIYMGGEKYILSIYFCGKRDYKIHKDNNDKFVKWEDACIAGIEYVINNLI